MHSTPAASYARCSLEFSGLEDEATRATSGRVGAAEAGACTLCDLPGDRERRALDGGPRPLRVVPSAG